MERKTFGEKCEETKITKITEIGKSRLHKNRIPKTPRTTTKTERGKSQTTRRILLAEKQKRLDEKRQLFIEIYDRLFEENKHSFITPVSKTEWEIMKEEELTFLFDERFFPSGITIADLKKQQKENIIFLRENPHHHCGPSIIFFLKTMVHRPRENAKRKLTKEELDWIFSLDLSNYEKSPQKSYPHYDPEDKKQRNIKYYEKVKTNQKTDNLNIRFMKEDPNRVLSVDDITRNPFVSNYSQRESYKINLWKQDKNPEFLEKWKKQRQDYEKIVENLSIEYKEEFLKNKWLAQY